MADFTLRPDADAADGNWTNEAGNNTNLYASIDETVASDADYIRSGNDPVGDICKIGLSDPGDTVNTPMTLRYRYKRGGPGPVDLSIRLLEGSTILASWAHSNIGDTFSTAEQNVVPSPSISDPTNLFLEFEASTAWWLADSAVDLDFVGDRYYDGAPDAVVTDLLSCSRASIGYAQTAAGTLTQFASNELRITDLGLLVEDARTNVVLWNRDLTNGAWTPSNITAAKDQAGPDGVSNSASSIAATAGNGTILQAITLASSARYQSAYIKRITGSGTVEMTMDNGATWTAITVTSNWTQVTIPTQTLANPTVGFRIVTSGDAVAVDFVQNEDGVFASSPIPTTTASAARAADAVTCIGNLSTINAGAEATLLGDAIANNAGTYQRYVGSSSIAGFGVRSNTLTWAYDGGTTVDGTLGGGVTGLTGAKIAVAWDASGRSLAGGGGTVVSDASDNPIPAPSFVGSGNAYLYGYMRRLTAWTSRLADATLQALTAP